MLTHSLLNLTDRSVTERSGSERSATERSGTGRSTTERSATEQRIPSGIRSRIAEAAKIAITRRTARIGVIGLGDVGLPIAVSFANAGFRVTGIDTAPRIVHALRQGKSPSQRIDDQTISALVRTGRLDVADSIARAATLDVIVVCVPTPCRGDEPDLRALLGVIDDAAARLRSGQLIVLESSIYPDTTERVIMPRLTRAGMEPDGDFFVGHAPRAIVHPSGSTHAGSRPKLVSGIGPSSAVLVRCLYEAAIPNVVPVSSPRVAELAQLFENTVRDVNIALVNELAVLANHVGVDIWEVLEAAQTKSLGDIAFAPGLGAAGGNCVSADPLQPLWGRERTGASIEMSSAARRVNDRVPSYIVDRIERLLEGVAGRSVLVLGATFKGDIDDGSTSSSAAVIRELAARGADVKYHDPFVEQLAVGGHVLRRTEGWENELRRSECVVVLVDHEIYKAERIVSDARLVFDTRNILAAYDEPSISRL